MNSLYRCKVRVGYKFFNSNRMVVFDEDQIASVDLKLNYEGSFQEMNTDTMVSKLMLYTSQQNTCNVSIKDPYFTSIAWPALLDVAGQTISSTAYSPGVATVLRECGKGEDPKKDGCFKYEVFNYNTYFATSFSGADPNELFATEDSNSYRYIPAMLLISLWYETPNGYTFGTDYVYMVTNASVSHGKSYPTVEISGAGNYGVVFQNGLLNMSISDKDNVEFSLTEIVKKLGYTPTFCTANYSEPRKLDRKVALRNVTAHQGISKIVKEYLGGDLLALPTKDFFKKVHICTRADGALGRKVFYLGKPLYEHYTITARYDKSFIGSNLTNFGGHNLIPGYAASSGLSTLNKSTYKIEEISSKDSSATILFIGSKNPMSSDSFSNPIYTINSPIKNLKGEWTDFMSDRDVYHTSNEDVQYFLDTSSPSAVKIETYNKLNSWYVGSWEGGNNAYAPIRGELLQNDKGVAAIRSDLYIYLKGNTTNEISSFPIYAQIDNMVSHEEIKSKSVKRGEKLGEKGEKDLLMRYYILNAGSRVYLDIPTVLAYATAEVPEAESVPTTPAPEIESSIQNATNTSGCGLDLSQITSLKELIISGESARDRAEAANNLNTRGTIKKYTGKTSSQITVGELMRYQEDKKIRAAGWLQIIPDTLKKVVAANGVSKSDKFSESTQDSIFLWLLKNKRPNAYNYLIGSSDDLIEASQDIAREWASIGISKPESPEYELRLSGITITSDHKRQRNVGQSLYAGVNGNKAFISPQTIQKTLKSIRDKVVKSCVPSTTSTTTPNDSTAPTNTTTQLPPGYVWPTTGQVTSVYGWRGGRMHKGIDIARSGADVVAAASGEVINVYNQCPNTAQSGCGPSGFQGYGNIVYIKHSNGQTTLYAHLNNNILVKKGDIVSQGQKLGTQADSGSSRGVHLHFEIRGSDGKALDFTSQAIGSQVTEGDEIPLKIDASGVQNFNGSSISNGASRGAVPAFAPSNSGFTIETEFKGMPRVLRLLPKFTTLSLISDYQEWLRNGKPKDFDEGIWVADEFFRNWIIKSISYMWKEGDLRVKIEGSQPLGASTQNIVPRWSQYQAMLRSQGKRDSYIDYIRAFGDLCWVNKDGYNSCEDPEVAEEIFSSMQNNQPASVSGFVGSGSGLCNKSPDSIGISSQEYKDLINMIASEARGEVSNESGDKALLPLAMVSRAILNRWIINRDTNGPSPYFSKNDSLNAVIFARDPRNNKAQFSPLDDGNFESKKSAEDLDRAEKAFQLSLNSDYLISLGVPKDALGVTNFRNPTKSESARDSNWEGGVYRPGGKNHVFSKDESSNRLDMYKLWEKYFGKCETINSSLSSATTDTGGLLCQTKYGHYPYAETPSSNLIYVSTYYGRKEYLHKDAASAFNKMKAEANAIGINLVLISGYRSISYQKTLYDNQVKRRGSELEAAKYSAPPGFSEHHSGFIADIGDGQTPSADVKLEFEKTKAFEWLKSNASKFGFELSFKPNNPQGISYEPWHWRFIGTSKAKSTFYRNCTDGTVAPSLPISSLNNKLPKDLLVIRKGGINSYTQGNITNKVPVASLNKLIIAYLIQKLFKGDPKETLNINPNYIYSSNGQKEDINSLYISNSKTNVETLLREMLSSSNNTAANVLVMEVLGGIVNANKLVKNYFQNAEIGIYGPDTRNKISGASRYSNSTTANNIVKAFEEILTDSGNIATINRNALSDLSRYTLKDSSSYSKIGITSQILGQISQYEDGSITFVLSLAPNRLSEKSMVNILNSLLKI